MIENECCKNLRDFYIFMPTPMENVPSLLSRTHERGVLFEIEAEADRQAKGNSASMLE
jgi:hypothetical protein